MAPGLFALLHSLPCLLLHPTEFAYEAANKANFSTLPNKMKLSEESEERKEKKKLLNQTVHFSVKVIALWLLDFALLQSLPCLLYILPECAYEAANKANFSTLPNKMKLSEERGRKTLFVKRRWGGEEVGVTSILDWHQVVVVVVVVVSFYFI
ncbi:hypothetical protein CEXT_392951 [Caerostris extrusa]|uniref:Uncharacterized protein n=1 Tax=Caerostris extrusa TaxID=172846 RepID=A0AAV4VLH4_CAEEX|nr:hypothetical protein CEXT_392951 [Caerostris extrusa]